jgi:UDP-N-acetylmuramate--alanine ligase
MSFNHIHSIYFIGIGGIGMSALARYFHAMGKIVNGYDKTATSLTAELEEAGMKICYNDALEALPESVIECEKENMLIVYTPAIPKENRQLNYFMSSGYDVKKRSQVLGEITAGTFSISIAGTHGKTTTSSILAHILTHSGKSCAAFLGGITVNYNTNFILPSNGKVDEKTIIVAEADEYDRSFLTLDPNIAVITSMDADHLDIYGHKESLEESFRLFGEKVKEGGILIYRKGLLLQPKKTIKTISYSSTIAADAAAENIRIENGSFVFNYKSRNHEVQNIAFRMPGRHNIENAVAAATAAFSVGISAEKVKEALETFNGVKRRFEYKINSKKIVFIDDYAHHPVELKACITAVRELYPEKKITGIFQPHLFTRTLDFADSFSLSLDMLDACILLEIYPARELPIEGVSSAMLLHKMKLRNKMLIEKKQLIEELKNRDIEVLLTLGAGDIDKLIEPIQKALEEKQ